MSNEKVALIILDGYGIGEPNAGNAIYTAKTPVMDGLLQRWLPKLESGSDAWLVVQRNLGSDSLHRWLQGAFPEEFSCVRASTNKGYRVLRARRRTGLTSPIDIIREQ